MNPGFSEFKLVILNGRVGTAGDDGGVLRPEFVTLLVRDFRLIQPVERRVHVAQR